MHYCGMCGVDLNLQLSLGCRRLLDPLPIVDLANQTYLHSLLTVLTDAECYEGELSGDGTLCFGCANSLEQLEHLQRQVRQKCSVADPGCFSRIRFFPIPDPLFSHPGSAFFPSRIRIKKLSILTPKNGF
jgi:hypothetical protein